MPYPRRRSARPEWIGSLEGPGDWGINFEKYIGLKPWGPGEGPKRGPSEKDPG